MNNNMDIEDYWEDASVCIGCSQFPASQPETESDRTDLPSSDSPVEYFAALSARPQPCDTHADSLDDGCALASLSRLPHEFPPPIALCSTVSIKEGGRFVLKETVPISDLPHCSLLRAERQHGRLRLHLIQSDEQETQCKYHNQDDSGSLSCQLADVSSKDKDEPHLPLREELYGMEVSEETPKYDEMEIGLTKADRKDSVSFADTYKSPREKYTSTRNGSNASSRYAKIEGTSGDGISICSNMDMIKMDDEVDMIQKDNAAARRACSDGTTTKRSSLEAGTDNGQPGFNNQCSSTKLFCQPCFPKTAPTMGLAAVS